MTCMSVIKRWDLLSLNGFILTEMRRDRQKIPAPTKLINARFGPLIEIACTEHIFCEEMIFFTPGTLSV